MFMRDPARRRRHRILGRLEECENALKAIPECPARVEVQTHLESIRNEVVAWATEDRHNHEGDAA